MRASHAEARRALVSKKERLRKPTSIVCIGVLLVCLAIARTLDSDALRQPLELLGEIALASALIWIAARARRAADKTLANVNSALQLLPPNTTSDFDEHVELDQFGRLELALNRLSLDITESRRKEKLLIERAVDVICVISTDARIVSINEACQRAWGYARADLLGAPLTRVLDADEAERVTNQILGGMQSIDKVVFESQVRTSQGSQLDVVWTGHWSASEGGLFCIVHDISQQKLVEKAVRVSEQRLRAILESLPAAVLVADYRNQIEFANHAASSLLGYQPEELLSRSIDDVFKDAVSLESLSAPQPPETSSEALAHTRSGTTIAVGLSRSKIPMSDSEKLLCVFLDRRAEQELQRTKRELTAMITHDLKSPLTAILGIFSLLEEGVCGAISQQGLQLIDTSRKQLKNIVRLLDDMLQVASIDAGSFELRCAEVRLHEVVLDAVETVRASSPERRFVIDADSDSVSAVCYADQQRLSQVLTNLLGNAVKYSPLESPITVTLEVGPAAAVISIIDEGRGIPPEKLDRIFDRFMQVEQSDATDKGGYGLGLAICKEIVVQHGGKIGVSSEVGKGSTFWLSLPIAVSQ